MHHVSMPLKTSNYPSNDTIIMNIMSISSWTSLNQAFKLKFNDQEMLVFMLFTNIILTITACFNLKINTNTTFHSKNTCPYVRWILKYMYLKINTNTTFHSKNTCPYVRWKWIPTFITTSTCSYVRWILKHMYLQINTTTTFNIK
jgi:hypothetical protein